jgi:hypothetical protein
MVDDRSVLAVQRLLDDITLFQTDLKARYPRRDSQVRSPELASRAADLAETWMVEMAPRDDFKRVVSPDYLAGLTVHFQRILTLSGRRAKRSEYDYEIRSILRDSRQALVIPLKQARGQDSLGTAEADQDVAATFVPTAFVAESFAPADDAVNSFVRDTLGALGITVVTGEAPKADRISEKVRQRIEGQFLFVGIFTRREALAAAGQWTTSAWLIDEKAYAVALGKKLVLLRESGVSTIGGLQGDYEYFIFSRERLHELGLYLIKLFQLSISGLSG